MSYCRFSCDNSRSGVYVYADVHGGYTCHVAGRKLVLPPIPALPFGIMPRRWYPCPPDVKLAGKGWADPPRWKHAAWKALFHLWRWSERLHGWSVHVIPLRPIRLPHAGDSFNVDTAGEMVDRLVILRAMGHRVPAHAIRALEEEAVGERCGGSEAADGA